MSSVIINGNTYTGNDIVINDNNVIIDGNTKFLSKSSDIVNVQVIGEIGKIKCNGRVTVDGTVNGDIDCGGSCSVYGDIKGSVDCGGNCYAMNVTGNVIADSINCSIK